MTASLQRLLETVLIGILGGFLFNLGHLPLPWVLGSLTFVMLWQGITKRHAFWPVANRNGGFIVLGMYFGLYFTLETFLTIGPYLIPYFLTTCILIIISIFLSLTVTKWIKVDQVTSVFGSIPGGLTEMIAASESLHAKTSLVAIFQTVRLLTVLFIVPASIIYYFSDQGQTSSSLVVTEAFVFGNWNYLWFIIPVIGGILIKDKVPAGFVIGPLAITAAMNIVGVDLPSIPQFVVMAAQVAVGIAIGMSISFSDLKIGGKYCFIYFGITLSLIFVSFGLGALLTQVTSLSLKTAILSVSPGGIIEMVLTAAAVGGDPAIVSALQLTRILIIVIFVPPILKWYFTRRERQKAA